MRVEHWEGGGGGGMNGMAAANGTKTGSDRDEGELRLRRRGNIRSYPMSHCTSLLLSCENTQLTRMSETCHTIQKNILYSSVQDLSERFD